MLKRIWPNLFLKLLSVVTCPWRHLSTKLIVITISVCLHLDCQIPLGTWNIHSLLVKYVLFISGPLLFCAIVYLIIFVLSLAKYFASKLTEEKLADLRTKLKSSFLLLPFVCALWGLALFAVNENKAQYYYIFAILNVTLVSWFQYTVGKNLFFSLALFC